MPRGFASDDRRLVYMNIIMVKRERARFRRDARSCRAS
jgi:hypothetical protein